jgi:hypothetical protein
MTDDETSVGDDPDSLTGLENPFRVRSMPNPYTRLEAIEVVSQRLGMLAALFEADQDPVHNVPLSGVLRALEAQLHVALWRGLAELEALRDGAAPTSRWALEVSRLLWP